MQDKPTTFPWLALAVAKAIPDPPKGSVVDWARENVSLVGSARSEVFDPDITPWTREPIECAANGCREMTFIKPVQSGGSTAGEIAICYWLATQKGGDIQYNWQNDEQAGDRWIKRVEKILKACGAVMVRFPVGPTGRHKWTKGIIVFPHCNLTMQGVNLARNVASDSIRFQVNEELHDAEGGWAPGRLQQCRNRTTAFWNPVIFNISNGGHKGTELHQAFERGTQQHWEVKCPKCGLFHAMRTRWEEKTGHLGGLRYNADGCRLPDGTYDYPKLAPTVRFQMPCGWEFPDDLSIRKKLSLSGGYSSPRNPGAVLTEKSFTLEAVSVDYIPFLTLIQEKHRALRAMKLGDPKPYWDYLRERECQFIDPEDRPMVAHIVKSKVTKLGQGLEKRMERYGALDRQQGSMEKGEVPHWWGLIQDIEELPGGKLHILTVWEGKLMTDDDAAAVMARHEVDPAKVVCDSGDDTVHVYQFCLLHGFNAIKESGEDRFAHTVVMGDTKRTTYHIYSKPTLLCDAARAPRSAADMNDEPRYWLCSHIGIRDRLAWLRASSDVTYEIPSDVSEDFTKHFNAETRQEFKRPKTGEISHEWVQHSRRNDLFVCACYIAMLMEIDGYIGAIPERKQTE